ncbi:MAG TPA: hypothetical protein VHM64_06320, partial [Candidatus Binatia bacterium]|nr:hypothetical protein [Candidatus Binatia bacterium]
GTEVRECKEPLNSGPQRKDDCGKRLPGCRLRAWQPIGQYGAAFAVVLYVCPLIGCTIFGTTC